MLKTILFFPIALFFFVLAGVNLNAETQAGKNLSPSASAAESWLQLVDSGNYGQSWDAGSATLQLLVPKKSWITLMESIRKPYGNIKSRNLLEERPAKDPKNLPKGDYMVLVFNSSFSQKPVAHELVTMVRESDGKWRVLTYQAK